MNRIGLIRYRKVYITLWVICTAVMSGCGSKQAEWEAILHESSTKAEKALSTLETQISTGQVRNATLLNRYADVVREQKPELSGIVDALAQDGKLSGPILQGLKSRLQTAKTDAITAPEQGEAAVQTVWEELEKIATASSRVIFGMMLTDPVNVLADMSDGTLARVAAMSKEASAQANQSSDMGAGSQLIGNPNYGQWQQDSSGNSMWQWFGMYALFSTLSNRPVYYGNWSGGRDYSYYHDYGRDHYTSPTQRKEQATVRQKAESKFKREGKTFRSPYAKTKTGATSGIAKPASRSTRAFKAASSGFKSNYQKGSSSRSSSWSSARGSSYRSSRSWGGGGK